MLTRENALVLVLALAAWMAWSRRSLRLLASAALPFAAGLGLLIAPVAARNVAVGGGLHLTTSQLGPNLWIGNNPDANGTYRPLRAGRGSAEYERTDAFELARRAAGRPLSPGDVSRYWTARSLEFVRSRPLEWLRLKGRTLQLALNSVEIVDTEDQYTHAEWSPVLGWTGRALHFGILAPLAVLGMFVTRRHAVRLAPLYLMLGSYLCSIVLFYVFARYRLPLVPLLIPFAAAALVGAVRFVRERPPMQVGIALATAALAAVACNWPLTSRAVQRATTFTNVGIELTRRGDAVQALPWLERAVALDPTHASGWFGLANALVEAGRVEDSVRPFREALRLRPGHAPTSINLANVLRRRGDPERAAALYRQALAGGGDLPDTDRALAANNLGSLLAELGRPHEAQELYREALQLVPDFAPAWNNLGLAQAALGDLAAAEASYRRALEVDPAHAKAHYNLGLLRAARGRAAEAAGSFRSAVEQDPSYAAAWRGLAWILATAREPGIRDPAGAIAAAERAVALAGEDDPDALEARAAALASAGRFAEAARAQRKAVERLGADDPRVAVARQRLRIYSERGGGLRDPSS